MSLKFQLFEESNLVAVNTPFSVSRGGSQAQNER